LINFHFWIKKKKASYGIGFIMFERNFVIKLIMDDPVSLHLHYLQSKIYIEDLQVRGTEVMFPRFDRLSNC